MEEYRSKHTGLEIDEALDNFNATKETADNAVKEATEAKMAAIEAKTSANQVLNVVGDVNTILEAL